MIENNVIQEAPAAGPFIRPALLWATAGAFAALAVIPYMLALNAAMAAKIPMAMPMFALVQFLQGLVFLSLLSWIGLRLGRGLGLGSPVVQALSERRPFALPGRSLAMAAGAGAFAGAAILLLDPVFQPYMPATTLPGPVAIAFWKRCLACLYGGITEELICRLFLMTVIVWICAKVSARGNMPPRPWVFWAGVIGAALLFGAAHLPATAGLMPLTTVVVSRALLLNGIAGVVAGYFYWRRGFEHAVVAHFCADIVLHVIGGT